MSVASVAFSLAPSSSMNRQKAQQQAYTHSTSLHFVEGLHQQSCHGHNQVITTITREASSGPYENIITASNIRRFYFTRGPGIFFERQWSARPVLSTLWRNAKWRNAIIANFRAHGICNTGERDSSSSF